MATRAAVKHSQTLLFTRFVGVARIPPVSPQRWASLYLSASSTASCEVMVLRRWNTTDSMASSAVNLDRSSDRLSKAVKVEAPIPIVPDHFAEGLNAATLDVLRNVAPENSGEMPSSMYTKLCSTEVATKDDAQVVALNLLDDLFQRLKTRDPPAETVSKGSGFLGSFLNDGIKLPSLEHDFGDQRWKLTWRPRRKDVVGVATEVVSSEAHQQGLYLHGGVGSGKTFLMDCFFYSLPISRKRRVHFHSFMMDVHLRVHKRRQRIGDEADPLPAIAEELVSEAWVLCFDEFQVTDVVDAMIMARLFAEFFRLGGVMVATSNRAPDDLYENGLQRRLFLPFIKTVKQQCVVHDMDSSMDYRLTGEHRDHVFMYPIDDHNTIRLNNMFKLLSKGEEPMHKVLQQRGRTINVPEACENTKIARFSFNDLCENPLGASDYKMIATHFHTVFISDIPVLDTAMRLNATRRFITLIDTLYEQHVKVICTADASPKHLLNSTHYHQQEIDLLGTADYIQDNRDELFAFQRTVSRLHEMQTTEYLQGSHRMGGKNIEKELVA